MYFSALIGGSNLLRNDPRVAPILGSNEPSELAWLSSLDAETNIEELVKNAKEFGVTGLKFYSDISNELLVAAVDEAKKQGLETWSHGALFTATPFDVIKSGVNSISHSDMLGLADLNELPTYIDVSQLFMSGGNLGFSEPYGANNQVLYQLLIANDVVLEPTLSPFKERGIENAAAYAKAAYETGVMIGVGTDNDGTVLDEMKLLMTHTGMTESEVIIADTANNAKSLGLEERLGTIEVGKIADLVVLSKNPLEQIDNLSSITHIVKEGKVHLME